MNKLELNSIQGTFIALNSLAHDFLHDYDLRNSSNVSRLKKAQKKFDNILNTIQKRSDLKIGGGVKDVYNFVRWQIEYAQIYEGLPGAEELLPIFEIITSSGLEQNAFDNEEINYFIKALYFKGPHIAAAFRHRDISIEKSCKLVIELINDIILNIFGHINIIQEQAFDNSSFDGDDRAIGYTPDFFYQSGGINPRFLSKSASTSPLTPPSKSSSSTSPLISPLISTSLPSSFSLKPSPISPPSKTSSLPSVKSETSPNIENGKKYYEKKIIMIISAAEKFKLQAKNEIENKEDKDAYVDFLTNFTNIFLMLTKRFDNIDPFKIVNSVMFKEILFVYLTYAVNIETSNTLNNFLKNSLFSDKKTDISIEELIKPPQGYKTQKGGGKVEDLTSEIESLESSKQYVSSLQLNAGNIDDIQREYLEVFYEIPEFNSFDRVNKFIEYLTENRNYGIISEKLNEIRSNERMNGIHIYFKNSLNKDCKRDVNNIFKNLNSLFEFYNNITYENYVKQSGTARRPSINFNEKFNGNFDTFNKDYNSNKFILLQSIFLQNINECIEIEIKSIDQQIQIKTKKIESLQSADLSPEEIGLGNKINKVYAIGIFRFLGLLDINEHNNNELEITDYFEQIIRQMSQNDIYSNLLSLELYILFDNKYTKKYLWDILITNYPNQIFNWAEIHLGSGLDTKLIEGVKHILESYGIPYIDDVSNFIIDKKHRNIINNAFGGLAYLGVTKEDNVLCPIASIVDAMPNCTLNSELVHREGAINVDEMNFTIESNNDPFVYIYNGIINKIRQGKNKDYYVDYVVQITSIVGNIFININNINLRTDPVLQAGKVYSQLLSSLFERLNYWMQSVDISVKEKLFWYNLTGGNDFESIFNLGARKGFGDFFQEVFSTFTNNGTNKKGNQHPETYGLMGDRPSGVRCIFFNLLRKLGKKSTINPNNISGYGYIDSKTGVQNLVFLSANPKHLGGGALKKIRKQKKKMRKNTRKQKRKMRKNTRKQKRKLNKKTRKQKRKLNKKTRKQKRKIHKTKKSK